jgi:uncharacterized protein (TIGR03067 family)
MSYARQSLCLIICLLLAVSFEQANDRAGSPERQKEPDAKKKQADAIKKELVKLRGEWEVVEFKFPGGVMKNFGKEILDGNIIVKEHWIAIKDKDGSESDVWKWRINPSVKPAALDFDMNEGETYPAIYRLDGDTLKVCGAIADTEGKKFGPANARPTDFSVKRGPNTATLLFTLKRVKK